MKNLLKNSKSLLVVAALGLSLTASAQEENKSKLSGSVDGYFRFTQGRTSKTTNTFFTQSHNSFEIGSANVRAEHSRGKAKFLVDLGVGKRIDVINANDLNKTSAVLIKELNVSFELLSDLTVTAGTFQRHFGIERIDAIENNNYSMSYMFTNSPLLNTGVKVNYKVDEFNVMIGVSNATGFKSAIDSNTKDKTYFGQIGYTLDKTKVSLNTQFASNNTGNAPSYTAANSVNYGLLNLTVKHELNDKVALALDGNFKRQTNDIEGGQEGNVIGVAGYLNYTVKENLGLAYRLEFFDDQKEISNLIGKGNVFSNTLSANYKIGNLNIVPEVRGDWDSAYSFGGKRYNVAGLVAAVYKF